MIMLDQASQPADKKPYSTPVVHFYGNIRTITQAFGTSNKAAADGPAGQGNINKTA